MISGLWSSSSNAVMKWDDCDFSKDQEALRPLAVETRSMYVKIEVEASLER